MTRPIEEFLLDLQSDYKAAVEAFKVIAMERRDLYRKEADRARSFGPKNSHNYNRTPGLYEELSALQAAQDAAEMEVEMQKTFLATALKVSYIYKEEEARRRTRMKR